MEGVFGCDHGRHPLRDYIIEFQVDQCKIQFRYTYIETYKIQLVNPKKYAHCSKDSLKILVQERKDKLQEILERALENFKCDQVKVLKNYITRVMA